MAALAAFLAAIVAFFAETDALLRALAALTEALFALEALFVAAFAGFFFYFFKYSSMHGQKHLLTLVELTIDWADDFKIFLADPLVDFFDDVDFFFSC